MIKDCEGEQHDVSLQDQVSAGGHDRGAHPARKPSLPSQDLHPQPSTAPRELEAMAACSPAALCELLRALQLILKGKIKSGIKRKPKFTEPKAAAGTLVCACMPGVQRAGRSGLEKGLDHASPVEQMHPCPRHDGFQAEGDG